MSNLSIFAEHAQRHAATMGVGASAAAGQSYALLKRQDAEASNAIIAAFGEDGTFAAVAAAEASSIATRDAEDGEKLAQGIALLREPRTVGRNSKTFHTPVVGNLHSPPRQRWCSST